MRPKLSTCAIDPTITGTNDDPVVDAIAPQDIQTDGNPLSAIIPVTFTDPDLSDVHTAQVTGVVATGPTNGMYDAAFIALMHPSAVVEPSGPSSGSLHFDFTADSATFDYLAGSDVLTLSYTLAIDDGHGGVTPQTAVVAIHGNSGFFVGGS